MYTDLHLDLSSQMALEGYKHHEMLKFRKNIILSRVMQYYSLVQNN